MSLGTCGQEVLRGDGTHSGAADTCGDEAVVLFGGDKTPLCLPHFEFQLTRVRRLIDDASAKSFEASRLLGGGG